MSQVLLNMHETAEALEISYERFRKVWRKWRDQLGFPGPVWGRRWAKEALAAWIHQRSGERPQAALPAPVTVLPDRHRAERDRRELEILRAE